jgi:DNA-binding CsgD family transcriptional regulator
MTTGIPSRRRANLTDLTPRERQIYQAWAAGMTVPQIARNLGLTAANVTKHLTVAREKARLSEACAGE